MNPLRIFLLATLILVVFGMDNAKAEASLDTSLEGFYNEYSFASVNGTAEYDITLSNDGDVDFETVSITAAFQDTSWKIENVTFSTSEESNNGTLSLPLAAGGLAQVHVSVFVGNGAKIDFAQVPLTLDIDADGTESSIVAIVCVTNWIAYESNYPSSAELNTYNKGDSYNYNLTVKNIAVTMIDNTTSPMDINDNIQLQYSSLSGWSVTSNDESWHPFYGGQLEGMLADEVKIWEITVNITEDAKAGEDILNFGASSTNPDDPFGMPYYQPYGLTVIPVNAVEWYGVGVSGAGMRNIDVSEGAAMETWSVSVSNFGNTVDTFDLAWDLGNIPTGWTISATPTTSGEVEWQGSSNFDVSLTVPADALSGSSASFLMTATSSSSSIETASQTFEVVVDQHYGVSMEVDTESKNGVPGSNVEFSFNLMNTGNGEDTFDVVVEGPGMWSPMSSVSSLTIDAVNSGQFLVSVMVPTTMTANSNSGNITIIVTSSDSETTVNSAITVVASQVFDITIAYGTGSDGTVTISEDTSLQIKLNITNNGNGIDTLTLELVNAPNWATLGADTLIVGTIPVTLVITLSPDTAAVSGRDYTFQVIATSLDGTEWTSPDLTAEIEVKATDSTDVVEEEPVDEEEFIPNILPVGMLDPHNPTSILKGADEVLRGDGTDIDGTIVNYRWTSSIDGDIDGNIDGRNDSFSVIASEDGQGTWTISIVKISPQISVNSAHWYLLDTDGNTKTDGLVSDVYGYYSGAVVFIDNDFNGKLSPGDKFEVHPAEPDSDLSAVSDVTDYSFRIKFEPNGDVIGYDIGLSNNIMIGTPQISTSTLSFGLHTITFQVQDNDGEWSVPVFQTLLVNEKVTKNSDAISVPSVSLISSIAAIGIIALRRRY